jgi:hypothetical protein
VAKEYLEHLTVITSIRELLEFRKEVYILQKKSYIQNITIFGFLILSRHKSDISRTSSVAHDEILRLS